LAVLALVSCFSLEAFAQCDPRNCGYRATGEKIQGKIEWDWQGIPGKYRVYRRTTPGGNAMLQATLQGNQTLYVTTMPSGMKITECRYFYIPVEVNSDGTDKRSWAGSEEILILRK
jgi:hypothetical protein